MADWSEAARRLSLGEVGVLPTDTMYGIVASALKPAAVERVYALRRRELGKPMIVLISSWEDFERFKIAVEPRARELLEKVWPGPVSVVLPAPAYELKYLHRGTGAIAFRMPAKPELRELLAAAGPIVAPSANLAGEPPSVSVAEAKGCFGEEVFYLDEGEIKNPPSALVDAQVFPPKILRPAPGFEINKFSV
ncbi:MAG: L-threonylcarbamoyladenylate synthase [Candidatus Saccharimonadales bacterium]